MYEVTLNQLGFAIIPVHIRPNANPAMLQADYKIDTGANCTTISVDWLSACGCNEVWVKSGRLLEGSARPTVASGIPVEDCYEIILPEVHIGDWVGYNWPFITSLSVPFKFLLGTDSMQFFNWQFDYENNVCKFDLIPGKRKLLFNQKEQSIHALDEFERKVF